MFQRKLLLTLLPALLAVAFLSSCKKEGGPGSSSAVYDTTETTKTVAVEEKGHHIIFNPKVGEVYRYRVTVTSRGLAVSQDDLLGQFVPKQESKGQSVYYVKQTVRQLRQDSTIDLLVHFDSILVSAQVDTAKVSFSSTKEADRKNPAFAQIASLQGQDIGVIVTRTGDIIEMSGTSNLVARSMAQLPDSLKTLQNQNVINSRVQEFVKPYILRTLTHFPAKELGKDTTWGAKGTQNIQVVTGTLYPGFVESTEKISGFEERGGKRLAVFDATSTVTPTQTEITQDPLHATLGNYKGTTHALSMVEDQTGVLVYRSVQTTLGYNYKLESKRMPGKRLFSTQNSSERAITELLK